MGAAATPGRRSIRFEPGERPPLPVALGLGLQVAITPLFVAILIPTIAFRAAGADDGLVSWAVFVSVLFCGLTAALQAVRFGRVGAGFIIAPAISAAAIAVTTDALRSGGPPLLAALVLSAAAIQLLFSARLSWLRRILTPTVSATVVFLLVVNVMPVIFAMLDDVPEGSPPAGAPAAALTTVLVISAIALKSTGAWRLWAPIIGVIAGSLVAVGFGVYDGARVAEAAWIAVASPRWPGLDLEFGPAFWGLLPAFVFVTLVTSMQTISSNFAIQNVSWRRRRAVDFRSVQNALATGGLGSLLAGLAGGMPLSSLSAGASLAELTGVASRAVGIALGIWLAAFAFAPKALALIVSVPGPVLAAYIAVLLAILFAVGLKLLLNDGFDQRKGLIVGLSFWTGLGFEYDLIFPELVRDFAGGLLTNGMTAGGIVAIVLTGFTLLTEPRASRLRTDLELAAAPGIREFLTEFATRSGFGKAMVHRLDAVCEETLLTLLSREGVADRKLSRGLVVTARRKGSGLALEFVAAAGSENVQDRVALLGEHVDEVSAEREVSLRLLRHLSSSLRHQQYHDTDIVTIQVDAPRSDAAPGETSPPNP
jgi:xanthine/uracil permease